MVSRKLEIVAFRCLTRQAPSHSGVFAGRQFLNFWGSSAMPVPANVPVSSESRAASNGRVNQVPFFVQNSKIIPPKLPAQPVTGN